MTYTFTRLDGSAHVNSFLKQCIERLDKLPEDEHAAFLDTQIRHLMNHLRLLNQGTAVKGDAFEYSIAIGILERWRKQEAEAIRDWQESGLSLEAWAEMRRR